MIKKRLSGKGAKEIAHSHLDQFLQPPAQRKDAKLTGICEPLNVKSVDFQKQLAGLSCWYRWLQSELSFAQQKIFLWQYKLEAISRPC